MAQDPQAFFNDLDDAADFAFGDRPAAAGAGYFELLTTEPEEITVRDAYGRVIGVIDLS
jgi:hypothetical protein